MAPRGSAAPRSTRCGMDVQVQSPVTRCPCPCGARGDPKGDPTAGLGARRCPGSWDGTCHGTPSRSPSWGPQGLGGFRWAHAESWAEKCVCRERCGDTGLGGGTGNGGVGGEQDRKQLGGGIGGVQSPPPCKAGRAHTCNKPTGTAETQLTKQNPAAERGRAPLQAASPSAGWGRGTWCRRGRAGQGGWGRGDGESGAPGRGGAALEVRGTPEGRGQARGTPGSLARGAERHRAIPKVCAVVSPGRCPPNPRRHRPPRLESSLQPSKPKQKAGDPARAHPKLPSEGSRALRLCSSASRKAGGQHPQRPSLRVNHPGP